MNFLQNVITEEIKILDIGCGAGYFVNAALNQKITATGIDVSKTLVNFGNKNILKNHGVCPLTTVEVNDLYANVRASDANVITAIGVIEHLSDPHTFFEAFMSSNVKYLYYSVPMFSLSVLLENIFSNVFPRQLSEGHTHLFTENSISFLNSLLDCETIAEWRFGTDFQDLFRMILTSLQINGVSEKIVNIFQDNFKNNIDAFQLLQDNSYFTSEIHVILRKI